MGIYLSILSIVVFRIGYDHILHGWPPRATTALEQATGVVLLLGMILVLIHGIIKKDLYLAFFVCAAQLIVASFGMTVFAQAA